MTKNRNPPGIAESSIPVAFNMPQLVQADELGALLGLTLSAATLAAIRFAVAVQAGLKGRRFVLVNAENRWMREIELDQAVRFSKRAERKTRAKLERRNVPVGQNPFWIEFRIRSAAQETDAGVMDSEFWKLYGDDAAAKAVWMASEVAERMIPAADAGWEIGYFSDGTGFEEAVGLGLPRGDTKDDAETLIHNVLMNFRHEELREKLWLTIERILSCRQVSIGDKKKFILALANIAPALRRDLDSRSASYYLSLPVIQEQKQKRQRKIRQDQEQNQEFDVSVLNSVKLLRIKDDEK